MKAEWFKFDSVQHQLKRNCQRLYVQKLVGRNQSQSFSLKLVVSEKRHKEPEGQSHGETRLPSLGGNE